MASMTPTDEQRKDPVSYWRGVSADQSYSPEQRSWATDQMRAEEQWVNEPERQGLTFRTPWPSPTTQTSGGTDWSQQPISGPTSTEQTQGVFNDVLIKMLSQDPSNVAITDPTLQPQAEAYRFARERGATQQQQQLAESLSSRGLGSSGAMDTGLGNAWQDAGQDIAGFEAQLVGNELTRRRQEILEYMRLAGGQMNADQARMLSKELAELNNAIENRRINVTADLGGRDLDLRALIAAMGNQQFYDNLGFNIGDREAYYNLMAMNGLGL
jgi:hypothetical protein